MLVSKKRIASGRSRKSRHAPLSERRISSRSIIAAVAAKKRSRKAPVDRGQRGEVGERHPLVDLVHGVADEAELDHRADVLEEARVRRAAAGRRLRRRCRSPSRIAAASGAISASGARQEPVAGARLEDRARSAAPAAAAISRLSSVFSAAGDQRSLKRMLKRALASRRDDVERRIADVDAGDLEVRRLEIGAALVEPEPRQPVEDADQRAASGCRRDADRRHGPACRRRRSCRTGCRAGRS